MAFDLNLHVYRLLQNEPFYAAISRRVNKASSTALPTAGVRIDKESKQFEMLYNCFHHLPLLFLPVAFF